jgi:hypothetical protein
MINKRLEKKSCSEKIWHEEEELWPSSFGTEE